MTAIVAPTIVRVGFNWAMSNGQIGTVLWDLSVDVGVTAERATSLPAVVTQLQDVYQDHIAVMQQKPVEYTGCSYHDLDSLDATSGAIPRNGSKPFNNGSTANQPAPPQIAVLVRKLCAHTRRQRPGRSYQPGISASNVLGDGKIVVASLPTLQTGFTAFLTGANAIDEPGLDAQCALRVVHKIFPTGWSSSDISSLEVQPYVATQRGRSFYN